MALQDIQNFSADMQTAALGNGFGSYKFGYLGEVNSSHNTTYPLMLITPPRSVFQDVYRNDESLQVVFHLFRPVIVTANEYGVIPNQNATTNLEQTFDELLELFKNTMNGFIKDNEHKYILDGNWEIERISSEHNDDLVGLIINLNIKKFTHCLGL